MAREILVTVPMSHQQTMALLLQAAEALQHNVVTFDATEGRAEIHIDFTLRSLATFRIHAEARAHSGAETELHLRVRPGFKLGLWTGVGQSERVGWQLIGKMQEIVDPQRYEALEDDVLPSRRRPAARAQRGP